MGKGKLKPCPFCGADKWEFVDRWYLLHKRGCFYEETEIETRKEMNAWNRRKEVKDEG